MTLGSYRETVNRVHTTVDGYQSPTAGGGGLGAYLGHGHRDLGSGGRGASRAERSRPRDDWGAAVEKLL